MDTYVCICIGNGSEGKDNWSIDEEFIIHNLLQERNVFKDL